MDHSLPSLLSSKLATSFLSCHRYQSEVCCFDIPSTSVFIEEKKLLLHVLILGLECNFHSRCHDSWETRAGKQELLIAGHCHHPVNSQGKHMRDTLWRLQCLRQGPF